MDFSKKALPEDPSQNNVTALDPVLDGCNKKAFIEAGGEADAR